MTQDWRGDPEEETGISRWYRNRLKPNSIYVLDIDRLICDPSGQKGLLIEEKHVNAKDKTATITRKIALDLGWWAALFVYETADGNHRSDPTRINATFWAPSGKEYYAEDLSTESFSDWVCDTFGARRREEVLL
jgi:hypothetical protein